MEFTFYKYQGTGNDFIMIDNRSLAFDKNNTKLIAKLCHRRFGIGADGLILLENHDHLDFKMVYFNSDGNQSSMCGNGGRCIVAFAKFLGIINNETQFEAIDGLHKATVDRDVVELHMQDVKEVETFSSHVFLNTGSPHHVQMQEQLEALNIKEVGSQIRYGEPYGQAGSNVNFVEQLDAESFKVRTYERGVEDETYSCGTGVTAVAIAMHHIGKTQQQEVTLKTPGGNLTVKFENHQGVYTNIWLIGQAVQVFKGIVVC